MSRPLFITGASGFIGRAVLAAAAARNLELRALTRQDSAALPAVAGLDWLRGELAQPQAWRAALDDAPTVLHMAALSHGPRAAIAELNVDGTGILLEQCRAAGVQHFVYVSSAVVVDGDEDAYASSKRAAEALVLASGIPAIILRPTLTIGSAADGYVRTVIARMGRGRPMLLAGQPRIQPVFVEDLAATFVAATQADHCLGRSYALAGRDALPFKQFLTDIADAAGIPAPAMVSLPAAIVRLPARVLGWCLGDERFVRRVRFGASDHVYDTAAAARDLGFTPEPWRAGIARRLRGAAS